VATKEIGAVDQNAEEIALRDVWYGRVLLDQGRHISIKADLSDSATARPNRTSRQDKVSA
jgi:hypothetical protein